MVYCGVAGNSAGVKSHKMKVYKEPCKNCLLSKEAIVNPKRKKQIISDCVQSQTHFICHKASIENKDICCKTFFDTLGDYSQLIRIAKRLNCIEFIELPDGEKLLSYNEINRAG